MKVNLFEGARRIALALGVLWLGGCVAYAILSEPHVSLYYSIGGLGAAPVRVDGCGSDDGRHYISAEDSSGNSVSVTLCFKTHKSDKGESLVPYAPAEGGRWWMADPYSAEVTRYMRERAAGFRLSSRDIEEAGRLRWLKRLEHLKEAAIAATSGIAVGWLLVAVTGWIVRGFLGVPRGRDSRPTL